MTSRWLILTRRDEALWNREQRFTGLADVELTAQGPMQVQVAARALCDTGIRHVHKYRARD